MQLLRAAPAHLTMHRKLAQTVQLAPTTHRFLDLTAKVVQQRASRHEPAMYRVLTPTAQPTLATKAQPVIMLRPGRMFHDLRVRQLSQANHGRRMHRVRQPPSVLPVCRGRKLRHSRLALRTLKQHRGQRASRVISPRPRTQPRLVRRVSLVRQPHTLKASPSRKARVAERNRRPNGTNDKSEQAKRPRPRSRPFFLWSLKKRRHLAEQIIHRTALPFARGRLLKPDVGLCGECQFWF
jgi:hypothetical protein